MRIRDILLFTHITLKQSSCKLSNIMTCFHLEERHGMVELSLPCLSTVRGQEKNGNGFRVKTSDYLKMTIILRRCLLEYLFAQV